jgi:CRISPR/Cas system CSM-associated protein Csm3 (group 7 of RAMP superfamily)
MKEIIYKIKFHSEWHCGSGLTSGSDLDALVIKDNDGFPFIPGKTLKGLTKEAAIEMIELKGNRPEESGLIKELFGYFDEKNIDDSKIHTKGAAFFSNAVLSDRLRNEAKEAGLTDFFFRNITSTAIGENGIADKGSLRRMETVIPCELVATISSVDEKYEEELKKCLKYIKRLGQNRHRGLGRCTFEFIEPKKEAKA